MTVHCRSIGEANPYAAAIFFGRRECALSMIKKSLILMAAAVLMLLCAACGADSERTADAETVLHLTCWIEDMELDRLIEEFEAAHPGVTVRVKAYYDDKSDFSVAASRMNAEIATGDSVDLYYLENAMDVMSLINVGLLADLYPLRRESVGSKQD